jgi:4-hydroxybenzoyl-CoA reductase subunit beta
MMRLPAFEYLEPSTVEQAVEFLVTHPGAEVVAGGTDLLPNMKRLQVSPATVVTLGTIEGLRGIHGSRDEGFVIGALTPLYEVAAASDIPAALASAAAEVASPQIRNVATIGGNLCADTRCDYINQTQPWRLASGLCLKAGGDVCWVAPKGNLCVAISASDLAPVVVALDAVVKLVGPDGERSLPAADLYRPDGIDYLGKSADEIITEVSIPPSGRRRTAYRKLRRRGSIDFPILAVAVAVEMSQEGTVQDARVVVGAVSPAPMRVREAEAELIGSVLDDEVIERAAEIASGPVRPYDNVDLGSRYRKWMTPVYITQALQDLR